MFWKQPEIMLLFTATEMLGLHVDNLPGAVSLAPPPTVVVPLKSYERPYMCGIYNS